MRTAKTIFRSQLGNRGNACAISKFKPRVGFRSPVLLSGNNWQGVELKSLDGKNVWKEFYLDAKSSEGKIEMSLSVYPTNSQCFRQSVEKNVFSVKTTKYHKTLLSIKNRIL